MDLSPVATSSPFSQSLLCPDDCFVLDHSAGGKVYVWKGAWGGDTGTQGRGHPGVALTPRLQGARPTSRSGRRP